MGTKYSSVSISGYNSSPPADDGTVSEANKVKWSTIKTKLPDPLKTAIEAINTALVTHFEVGPTSLTSNTTLDATHNGKFIQVSGSSITLTLTDASTLGAGWWVEIFNIGSAAVAISRATGGNTIDGTAADIVLYPTESFRIFVIAAATGFFTSQNRLSHRNGIGPQYLQNLSFTASVGSNALTVALKGKDGNDPSAGNPVEVSFRSTTATSSTYNVRRITAAASVVLPQGGTLGFNNAETGFIYVYLCDDGSTRAVGLARKAIFDESALYSTTAIGTGSDSATVLYTTAGLTGAAVRLIGRITIATGATAGDWSSSATRIEPWTPSMKKTGDIIQRLETHDGAFATTTTATPYDNTIPQNTEGVQVVAQAITPTNALNTILTEAQVALSPETANDVCTAHLHKDNDADAVKASAVHLAASEMDVIRIYYAFTAGGTSAITMKLRAGRAGGNTLDINGGGGSQKFNGVANTYIRVWEEQA